MTLFYSIEIIILYCNALKLYYATVSSSHPETVLRKGVLKICSKFIGEHPCRSMISVLRHGCSPVNLLHISRTPFPRNTSGWLLLCYATVNNYKAKEKEDHTCALRDLVPFAQFKKREKDPLRSVNFSKVAGFSLQLY